MFKFQYHSGLSESFLMEGITLFDPFQQPCSSNIEHVPAAKVTVCIKLHQMRKQAA